MFWLRSITTIAVPLSAERAASIFIHDERVVNLMSFAAGIGLGVGVGLLVAPASGKQTQGRSWGSSCFRRPSPGTFLQHRGECGDRHRFKIVAPESGPGVKSIVVSFLRFALYVLKCGISMEDLRMVPVRPSIDETQGARSTNFCALDGIKGRQVAVDSRASRPHLLSRFRTVDHCLK